MPTHAPPADPLAGRPVPGTGNACEDPHAPPDDELPVPLASPVLRQRLWRWVNPTELALVEAMSSKVEAISAALWSISQHVNNAQRSPVSAKRCRSPEGNVEQPGSSHLFALTASLPRTPHAKVGA